jgi:hypothetical protein
MMAWLFNYNQKIIWAQLKSIYSHIELYEDHDEMFRKNKCLSFKIGLTACRIGLLDLQ